MIEQIIILIMLKKVPLDGVIIIYVLTFSLCCCAGVPSLDAAKDFTVDGLTGYNGKKKKKKRRHRSVHITFI